MPVRRFVASTCAKIFAVTLGVAAPLGAQCGPPDQDIPAVRESLLVSTEWLAAHLRDSNLVVLYVGHPSGDGMNHGPPGPDAHIPGARLANNMAFAVGANDLPPMRTLDSLVEGLGISSSSRVVLYGDGMATGWLFMVLDVMGHGARTAVLDGSIEQWRAERRPVVNRLATAPARGSFGPRPKAGAVVDAAWVRMHLTDADDVVIIDGRSAGEYAGSVPEELPRRGHIAGAYHLDWVQTYVDPAEAAAFRGSRLKNPGQLRTLFRQAGVTPGTTPVLYCTVGLRASHLYFVLRYLGYDPKLYDGSMVDWSRRTDHPLVTGTARGTP